MATATPAADVLHFELQPGRSLSVLLYVAVTSCAPLRSRVLSKALDVALLDASLVVDPFCLHLAANKALHASLSGRQKAQSLHAELVHALRGGSNVGEALRTLGARDASPSVLVAVFDAPPGVLAEVDGLMLADDRGGGPGAGAAASGGGGCRRQALATFYPAGCDAGAVAALYRVPPLERALAGGLREAIVGRIALGDS